MNFEIITPDKVSGGSFYISLTLNRYSRYDSEGGHSLVSDFESGGEFIKLKPQKALLKAQAIHPILI